MLCLYYSEVDLYIMLKCLASFTLKSLLMHAKTTTKTLPPVFTIMKKQSVAFPAPKNIYLCQR